MRSQKPKPSRDYIISEGVLYFWRGHYFGVYFIRPENRPLFRKELYLIRRVFSLSFFGLPSSFPQKMGGGFGCQNHIPWEGVFDLFSVGEGAFFQEGGALLGCGVLIPLGRCMGSGHGLLIDRYQHRFIATTGINLTWISHCFFCLNFLFSCFTCRSFQDFPL